MAVKNNLKLIFSYLKLNIKKEWKYKASFFMQIIMMILNDLFFIIQWVIIFSIVDDIGGYGFREVMLLWSINAGGFGVARLFFSGAWNIKDYVYEGKLDVFLTQPKSVLLNVCCSSTEISALGDILYSFIILAIIGASWSWFLICFVCIILAGIIYTSCIVLYSCLSFYVKRGDSLRKSVDSVLLKTANYPPSIYNNAIKWILLTIVPTFFFTFVPVQYFFLTPNIWWILIEFAVMVVWVLLAKICFNLSLKRYNSGNLMGGRL